MESFEVNEPQAFEEGRAAFHNDLTLEDNPYSVNYQEYEHILWMEGFEFAADETLGDDEDAP